MKWLTLIPMLVSLPAWGAVTGFSTCEPAEGAFCSGPVNVVMGGKVYVKVSGLMEGTIDFGSPSGVQPYKAPISLMYPADVADCSGTGIVDLVNNSGSLFLNDLGVYFPPLGIGALVLGDTYVAKRGHALASLQYQRISSFGQDPIQAGIDHGFYPPTAGIPAPDPAAEILASWVVLSDGAAFLRNLGSDPDFAGACSSSKVISIGYSQSAFHQRLFSFTPQFWGTFDGNLLGAHGVSPFIGESPEGSGKSITVNNEHDVQILQSEGVRGDTDWYKVYEVAGSSHTPMEAVDIAPILALWGQSSRQNPVRISPVFRTMMDHLVNWIDGTSTPPPSAYLDASSNPNTHPECVVGSAENLFEADGAPTMNDVYLDCPRDPAKGNALSGGIRLPHVVTEVDGELAGAPLGNYGGVEPASPYLFAGILPNISFIPVSGGSYSRYTDQELTQRYGVFQKSMIDDALSGPYLGSVARAAEYAESQGWINEEEKRAYIKTAQDCARGKAASLSSEDLLACHGI
ncbi:MAG TPA: alpha/beta hydrolase domain-containing protein [bacterium]|nr:alpha/beta hydrolase domain-containing protein [bacterium]